MADGTGSRRVKARASLEGPACERAWNRPKPKPKPKPKLPSPSQGRYLIRGLDQAGGKLPLFDEDGQAVDPRTIRACIERGWAEPWFANPLKPDWLVCKLTGEGRRVAGALRKRGGGPGRSTGPDTQAET